jgi:hypothetical protein
MSGKKMKSSANDPSLILPDACLFRDIVANNNVRLNAFDAVILKARSAGTTTTLSLLAIVVVIVKLLL